MASSFLQKARERKIVYFSAIAVLFTVSLIHREFLLKPQAFALQLRESARGEVELTSSAVRLLLTGSRGLAVTILWYNAMDKQKRNEWHELEILVKSITKLQPYFITPWLYQSWNISFNVAVECDRPRDKYYYISRGIELLSEGERRNRGAGDEAAADDKTKTVFPGNPELRHFMGFYYQLKIGTSDERLTMRSLLELSCIDPIEKNPDRFWGTTEKGEKIVKPAEFARFIEKYPRLVRRLREQLGMAEPASIIRFLENHQKIPHRFKQNTKAAQTGNTPSELKDPLQQFPIFPPRDGDVYNPEAYDLTTSETVDVFFVCRAWYTFAQKPLPPANPRPGLTNPDYDKMRYRVPKQMMIQIFRHYPARAQVYIAETLESEGFFDEKGWLVLGWFDDLAGQADGSFLNDAGEFEVGTHAKFHSRWAWQKGHYDYKRYGEANGLYFTPAELAELTKKAELARTELKLAPGQMPQVRPRQWHDGVKGESYDAHVRLRYYDFYRSTTNFDGFFDQSEGEMNPLTVQMRKLLFTAERKRRADPASESLLALYDRAWPLYVRVCFEHPKFGQVGSMQEDLYEIHQRYLRLSQDVRGSRFKNSALWFANRSFAPMNSWPEAVTRYFAVSKAEQEQQQLVKIIPFRTRRGPLDAIHYYDGAGAKELREALFLVTQGAQMAMSPRFDVAAPETGSSGISLQAALPYPGVHFYFLNQADVWNPPVSPWHPLITDETRRVVGERPGMKR